MKRIISVLLSIVMIMSLLNSAVYADGSSVGLYGDNILFGADFDILTPETVKTDANNTSVSALDDDNVLVVGPSSENKHGIYWSVKNFEHSTNTYVKFDIMHENANFHFQGDVWDKSGNNLPFRIDVNGLTSGTWYTYYINLSSTGTYPSVRKSAAASEYEVATVTKKNASTSDPYTNTIKLGAGSRYSGTSSTGIWYVDNIMLCSSFPAMTVVIDEDGINKELTEEFVEDFEGATHKFSDIGTNVTDGVSVVTDSDNEKNNVLDLDFSKSTIKSTAYSGSVKSTTFTVPETALGYTVSFDFKRVGSGADGDFLWFKTASQSESSMRAIAFKLSQFQQNEWYAVSYNVKSDTAGNITISGTKTLKKDGTVSELSVSNGNNFTSNTNRVVMIVYNASNSSYTGAEGETSPWVNTHIQLDNYKFLVDESLPITTELVTNKTSGSVLPFAVAYDENGVLTAITEGSLSELSAIGTIGAYASSDFDTIAKQEKYHKADSVKIYYWDSFQGAAAYCAPVEIGDAIPGNISTDEYETAMLELTGEMQPDGGNGNYTVFAYSVPYITDKDDIPVFDKSQHTPLALFQQDTAISQIKYNASLYNKEYEDIVLVTSADGAQTKTTLIEYTVIPDITNITMLLGADETKRNFTWFSLSNEQGIITYEKKEDMTDGGFSPNAQTANAFRDHEDTEYSLKEYYYNNKATINNLEPDTTYCYRISNGDDVTDIYSFTTGSRSDSFSFAFGGDAQVGGSEYVGLEQEYEDWGRTLRQMTTADEFKGIDFFVHAGDQVDSSDEDTDIMDEQQYDAYINHDEFKSTAQVVVLGNHDYKTQGRHHQHFYQPNMSETAGYQEYYYGKNKQYIQSADYYFVYNNALFIVLNTNDFKDTDGSAEKRALDKEKADAHGNFIKQAIEATKDRDIRWKIVMYHQSPYGSSYHNDYRYKSGTDVYSRSEQYAYVNMREYLIPYLYENDIDLVLSGHDHCYTRTHIIKPAKDSSGSYTAQSVITSYFDGSYTYADGTNVPTYVDWKDRIGITHSNLKVSSLPLSVKDPDGILHITGASSSGSQINANENPSHYSAITANANDRHLSRIDITSDSITITTYNLGETTTELIEAVDAFTLEKTDASQIYVKKTTLGDTWNFYVGINAKVDAQKVYVAGYDKDGALVSCTLAEYTNIGDTHLTMKKSDEIDYFKAFVWSDGLTPLRIAKEFR